MYRVCKITKYINIIHNQTKTILECFIIKLFNVSYDFWRLVYEKVIHKIQSINMPCHLSEKFKLRAAV